MQRLVFSIALITLLAVSALAIIHWAFVCSSAVCVSSELHVSRLQLGLSLGISACAIFVTMSSRRNLFVSAALQIPILIFIVAQLVSVLALRATSNTYPTKLGSERIAHLVPGFGLIVAAITVLIAAVLVTAWFSNNWVDRIVVWAAMLAIVLIAALSIYSWQLGRQTEFGIGVLASMLVAT